MITDEPNYEVIGYGVICDWISFIAMVLMLVVLSPVLLPVALVMWSFKGVAVRIGKAKVRKIKLNSALRKSSGDASARTDT